MRALYISYHFPPTGGAGVQRAVKFVRYLPDFGITPVVLTAPEPHQGRWTPRDETLLDEVPRQTEIVRVASPEPQDTDRRRTALARWLRVPTPWTGWWRRAIVETGQSVRDVDVVLCSMSPFESASAAAQLARLLDVPWVADLRDPWALDEMMRWTTTAHRHLEARAMRRVLRTADAVIMNTEVSADILRERFPEFRDRHVFAIPNGFDSDDFIGPEPQRDDDTFRIVHTGYLHTQLGLEHRARSGLRRRLGGSVAGVDFLTRSHVFLLDALDRLAESHPEIGARVELWLAGVLSDADRAQIGDRPHVRTLGYLSHVDTIALMRSADLLFLPMHDVAPGQRASIVPGKAYEYLASGRPVLAAVPNGDARDLVGSMEETIVCRPSDVDAMAAAIARQAARPRVPSVTRPQLQPYERRQLTARLAEVLRSARRA